MGTLDGLREQIKLLYLERTYEPCMEDRETANNIAVKHALALIDAYEREHPGLVDRTQPCEVCGAPGVKVWVLMFDNRYVERHLCQDHRSGGR